MRGVVVDVALEPLLFGPAILEPNLDNAHVQAGVHAEPLADVARRLRRRLVSPLERLQLLGGDCGSRALVARVGGPLASSFVVGLAHELAVLGEVKLVAGVELLLANNATEASQVIHVVLGAPDLRAWRDAELAVGAARLGELAEKVLAAVGLAEAHVALEGELAPALGAHQAPGVPVRRPLLVLLVGQVRLARRHQFQDEPVEDDLLAAGASGQRVCGANELRRGQVSVGALND